jgi:ech hydrogenase subunit F
VPNFLNNVLENLFSKPATTRYPFEKVKPKPGTRGEIKFNMQKCDQCQDCERTCPSAAIKVYPEEKKIEWNPFKCIYCHACVRACMHEAIEPMINVESPDYLKTIKTFES